MNNQKRVDLNQKIQYLHQKIDLQHVRIKKQNEYELTFKFIELIDSYIKSIYQFDKKKESPIKPKQMKYNTTRQTQLENSRIKRDRQDINERLRQLQNKQKQIQIESLRVQIENTRLLKHNMQKQNDNRQKQLKEYIYQLQIRVKSLQKQIQKLAKINTNQSKEIDILKQQRNRAEKSTLTWKQKYELEIGMLETFNDKKNKYSYRNLQGIRTSRIFTNVTTDKKGFQRLVLCNLPIQFHVIKIAYGIKVGVVSSKTDVQYMNEVILYEKQEVLLSVIDQSLMLQYLKRKVTVNLSKYRTTNNQVVIMLYGKGDSVSIDQTE